MPSQGQKRLTAKNPYVSTQGCNEQVNREINLPRGRDFYASFVYVCLGLRIVGQSEKKRRSGLWIPNFHCKGATFLI